MGVGDRKTLLKGIRSPDTATTPTLQQDPFTWWADLSRCLLQTRRGSSQGPWEHPCERPGHVLPRTPSACDPALCLQSRGDHHWCACSGAGECGEVSRVGQEKGRVGEREVRRVAFKEEVA